MANTTVEQASILVIRPVAEVWSYLCNLERHHEWAGEPTELIESTATLVVGATFVNRLTVQIGKIETSWLTSCRIVEIDAQHIICWESSRPGFLGSSARSLWRWRLVPEDTEQTRVTLEACWRTRFPMSLLADIVGTPEFGDELSAVLERFKAALETTAAH